MIDFPWLRVLLMAVLVLLLYFCTSCARTTFYHEGRKIADFQGDMTKMDLTVTPAGSIRWHAASVDHSAATRAQGEATAGKINALGLAAASAATASFLRP